MPSSTSRVSARKLPSELLAPLSASNPVASASVEVLPVEPVPQVVGKAGGGPSDAECEARSTSIHERGFGPEDGETEVFGMVNLTKSPPSKGGPKPTIQMQLGEVRTRGDLNPHVAMRILRQRIGALRSCYRAPIERKPKVHGSVDIEIEIEIDECGFVLRAETVDGGTHETELRTCLVHTLNSLGFPRPSRVPAVLTVPLTFSR